MAAAIFLFPKGNANSQNIADFFRIIDPYIKNQGFQLTDQFPRTYFYDGTISGPSIKAVIHSIKTAKGYSQLIQHLYYSSNLMKG